MLFRKISMKIFGYLAFYNFGNRLFLKYERSLLSEQNDAFLSLGLDRGKGLNRLNTVLVDIYGVSYSEKRGMWSEHLLIFAAIATSERAVGNILEIGTFNGETVRILSALFPSSQILTVDLPFSEIKKTNMYQYETKNSQLILKRNGNLKSLSNVKFIEKNSLTLMNTATSFDLIWVDGDHSYPVAAIDIANAVRMLNPDGIGICDDVYLDAKEGQLDGRSKASIETLKSLNDAGLISYELVRKRIGGYFNFPAFNKKYLGIIKKV
jgi:predicted O-methyltransferase YrrM